MYVGARGVIIALSVVILGVGLVAYGLWSTSRSRKSKRVWKRTIGMITMSEVTPKEIFNSAIGLTRTYYVPHAIYEYEVDGKQYQGTRLTLEPLLGNRNITEARDDLRRRYPRGKRVDVYFNPANPAEATLEMPLEKGKMVLALGISTLTVATASILIYLAVTRLIP